MACVFGLANYNMLAFLPVICLGLVDSNARQIRVPGAHYRERSTPTYSCNGIFMDLSIFRLKFPQIQSPRGASLTSLMLCIILM